MNNPAKGAVFTTVASLVNGLNDPRLSLSDK